MSKALTATEIFEADDIKMERVEVPEWNGHVFVKSLTALERDVITQQTISEDDDGERTVNMKGYRAALVAMATVDREGKRLFQENDIARLNLKSSVAMDRVCEIAERMNALGAAAVKELEKNSNGTRSENSPVD